VSPQFIANRFIAPVVLGGTLESLLDRRHQSGQAKVRSTTKR